MKQSTREKLSAYSRKSSPRKARVSSLACALCVVYSITVHLLPLSGEDLLLKEDFSKLDEAGFPQGWQLNVFHESPRPEVAVVADGDRKTCRVAFTTDHPLWCVSLNHPLPAIDPDAELSVSFSIRRESKENLFLSVAVSAGPGCSVPCVRNFLDLPRSGEWQTMTVRMPCRDLKPEGNVLEFTAERSLKAGDAVTVADVRVVQRYLELMSLRFTNPVSGVVFTDAPSQKIAGVVRVIRLHSGRPLRVTLTKAESTDTVVQTLKLTSSPPLTSWSFDLGRLPRGKYVVRADLLGDAGEVADHRQLCAWRLAPTRDTTRVIDGKVYRGKQPMVLLGTYHVCDFAVKAVNKENERIGAPTFTREKMLADLAKQKLPAFFYSWGLPPSDFLDASKRHGLFVIPEVSGLGRDWGGKPLTEQAAPFADDPRVLAWGGWDEPSPAVVGKALEVYGDLKSVTPRKLVVTSYCTLEALLSLKGEGTTADLILMDIYRVNRADADLSDVGSMVKHAVEYGKAHGGIAVGVAPQAFIYAGGPEPTPEQLRAQIYLGLVNGARAFFPYAYIEDYLEQPFSAVPGQPSGMSLNPSRNRWFLPDSRMWLSWPRIAGEIRSLQRLLLEDGKPIWVTADKGPVQFLAKHVRGGDYLIAVNPQATPHEVTFRFAHPVREAHPLFGAPSADPRDRELKLKFDGYEVKVYRLGP